MLAMAGFFALAGVCSSLGAEQIVAVRSVKPAASTKPMPLVNADPDFATYFTRIETLVKEQAFAEAIRQLQDLIDKGQGFMEIPGEGRRFVSIRIRANQMISQLGEHGLEMYRGLSDAQAQRLYEDGLANSDAAMLQQVVDRYLYSSWGRQAIDALAGLHFDRAEFYRSASLWRRQIEMSPASADVPLLKTKIAMALHLAGEKKQAEQAMEELKKDSSDATGLVAGRQQNLAAFLEAQLSQVPAAQKSLNVRGGWPGWGGVPDGLARMDDSQFVLGAQWRYSLVDAEDLAGNIFSKLLVDREACTLMEYSSPYSSGGSGVRSIAEMDGGQVRIRLSQAVNPYTDRPMRVDAFLPAFIQPVAANGKVIFRTSQAIIAQDLYDGQTCWTSQMQMVRPMQQQNNVYYGYYPYWNYRAVDNGRYSLTAGDGKIFCVGNFRKAGMPRYEGMPGPDASKDRSMLDNSSLAALDVDTGKRLWELPGSAADEVLKNGKFLSAPTYSGGRLYVVSVYGENGYYALCLSAADGSLIWKQHLSQAPILNSDGGMIMPVDRYHAGSPPAVAEGKVLAMTNSGVVAALDAGTGQPLWAYQYPSVLEPSTGRDGMRQRYDSRNGPELFSANPMVVTRGRVICLPADCMSVIALSCENGQMIWQANRRGQSDLTGIDQDRLLLSGEGVRILSADSGSVLSDAIEAKDVVGRPAVTASSILASGRGAIYEIRLSDYSLTKVNMSSDGLLGNLLCVDGKTLAANAAGVCAYFKYEDAQSKLTQRIAAAEPEDQTQLLTLRGQLALNAQRYAEAVADFQAAGELATKLGDEASIAKTPTNLYLAYVGLGNQAGSPAEMIEQFKQADRVAQSNVQRAQMLQRLAKAYEAARQFDAAAAVAQQLAEQYPMEEIVVAEVGPGASKLSRFSGKEPQASAYSWAHAFIGRLIEAYGRACYKAFEEQAKAAFKQALIKGNPEELQAVEHRWPRSECALDALMSAAEIYYRSATGSDGEDAAAAQQQAARLLSIVCNRSSGSRAASACVALAMLYARDKQMAIAQSILEPVRDIDGSTAISFANIKGRLDDVLGQIEAPALQPLKTHVEPASSLELPLKLSFTTGDRDSQLLRSQDGRAVRVGQNVASLRSGRMVLLDPSAMDAKAASTWSGLLNANWNRGEASTPATTLITAMDKEGKLIVAVDANQVTALDVASAKVVWYKSIFSYGIGQMSCMAIGSGVLVIVDTAGKVCCVDLTTGKLAWSATLFASSGGRMPVGVPQIGGRVVAICFGGQTLHCYSLDTGKLIGKWTGASVDCLVSPSGLVATQVDKTLALQDPADLSKPLWTKTYPQAPQLLCSDIDRLAVLAHKGSQKIGIYRLTGGGEAEAGFATSGSAASIPVDGVFDGASLYVTCSNGLAGSLRQDAARPMQAPGMAIQKFTIGQGISPQWCQTIVTSTVEAADAPPALVKMGGGGMAFSGQDFGNRQGSSEVPNACYIMPISCSRQYIAVTCKTTSPEYRVSVMILDTRTGSVAQTITLLPPTLWDEKTINRQRYAAIRAAVITNGQLAADSPDGVVVYAK